MPNAQVKKKRPIKILEGLGISNHCSVLIIMIMVLKFLIIAYIWCSWWRMFLTSWFPTFLFYYDLIWPGRGFQSIAWNISTSENILKKYCIDLNSCKVHSCPMLWNRVLKFLFYNLSKSFFFLKLEFQFMW